MRKIDRNAIPGPSSLLTPGRAGAKELTRAITHYIPRDAKAFNFQSYKGDDVRHCLETLFHGKCAYCESRYDISGPVDIEHFRPKAGIDNVPGHRGYWWLAGEWTNLLPSCLDCNRRRYQPTPEEFASLSGVLEANKKGFASIKTGKETCFPIADKGVRMQDRPMPEVANSALEAELALLLDPCRDDPGEHLRFHIDRDAPLGIIYPVRNDGLRLPILPEASNEVGDVENAARRAGISVRGAVSIQIYGLNRLALIQERTRLLRRLEFLGGIVIDLSVVADNLENMEIARIHFESRRHAVNRLRATVSRTLAEIISLTQPEAPFSAMARAWIDVFKASLANPPTSPDEPLGWTRQPINPSALDANVADPQAPV